MIEPNAVLVFDVEMMSIARIKLRLETCEG